MGRFTHGKIHSWEDSTMGIFAHGKFRSWEDSLMGRFAHGKLRCLSHCKQRCLRQFSHGLSSSLGRRPQLRITQTSSSAPLSLPTPSPPIASRDVSDNSLTGSLPLSASALSGLQMLYVHAVTCPLSVSASSLSGLHMLCVHHLPPVRLCQRSQRPSDVVRACSHLPPVRLCQSLSGLHMLYVHHLPPVRLCQRSQRPSDAVRACSHLPPVRLCQLPQRPSDAVRACSHLPPVRLCQLPQRPSDAVRACSHLPPVRLCQLPQRPSYAVRASLAPCPSLPAPSAAFICCTCITCPLSVSAGSLSGLHMLYVHHLPPVRLCQLPQRPSYSVRASLAPCPSLPAPSAAYRWNAVRLARELGRNYFSGSLPTSLGQLTALISLHLHSHQPARNVHPPSPLSPLCVQGAGEELFHGLSADLPGTAHCPHQPVLQNPLLSSAQPYPPPTLHPPSVSSPHPKPPTFPFLLSSYHQRGLQGNDLGGPIPSQLGALISLNTLLTTTCAALLSRLKSHQRCVWSNNHLRGALPPPPQNSFRSVLLVPPPSHPSSSLFPLFLPSLLSPPSPHF
ncbi:unnamed protein product [Closterium sp. NIES-65]|nr:unnamed protein product [Closterium sp. NIES-65]